ncbi:MAG: aspartate aminotransferase family protein [Verrucomicrobiales bacterium]|jgi:4-aminobutyrate aminotransferase-like enzyme|nr:aspartate aminotransferase family protein [Verrucomicrobiales bacterium]
MVLPKLVTEVPGKKSRELARRLRACESRNVTFVTPDFPVFWERADGGNVWDVDGNCFLDLTSAFGVATAGFGAEHKKRAFAGQSAVLEHGMGDVHPAALKVELCERLAALTFGRWGAGAGKVALGNSGFEAVETALKTALMMTGKRRALAFEGAYHGLGFGSLTVNGWDFFKSPFRAQLADFADFVPFPRSAAELEKLEPLMARILSRGETGVILAEPILGRGGEVVPPDGFLRLLRRLADRHGALLALDEIYTGFFRTGRWFACEHEQVVPDLVCLGKALTGAFPLSACVGRAAVMDAWPESAGEALHTSTFLGHPVGCALALAALEFWADADRQGRVAELAAAWRAVLEPLRSLPAVADVRGRGLLWGVELKQPNAAGALMISGLQRGLILLSAGRDGRVLSLAPGVALTMEEIAFAGGELQRLVMNT